MTYKYSVGDCVIWKHVPCEVIARQEERGEYIYTVRRSDTNTTLNPRETNLLDCPSWEYTTPAPTTGIPDPETIPGDRDADYPVTEEDAMTVFKTFAVAAVVIYAVVRIIWG